MKLWSLALTLFFVSVSCLAQNGSFQKTPLAPLNADDFARLEVIAPDSGYNLKADIGRIYARGKQIDEAALAGFFKLSLFLNHLDVDARANGQVVLNTFLYLGEGYGLKAYARVLDRQPARVQQRVRDFLFYPYSVLPVRQRDEAREIFGKGYPTIFPKDFKFAERDSLFVALDNPNVFSFRIVQDSATKDLIASFINISQAEQQYVDSLSGPVPKFLFQ